FSRSFFFTMFFLQSLRRIRLHNFRLLIFILILIKNERKDKCHTHCDDHLDNILNRLFQTKQDSENTRYTGSFCSQMYDGGIECPTSSSDTPCDKRFEKPE